MDELDCEDLEGSDFCFVEMKRSRRSIGLTEKKTLLEIVRRADDGRVLKTLENPDPKTNALKKKGVATGDHPLQPQHRPQLLQGARQENVPAS